MSLPRMLIVLVLSLVFSLNASTAQAAKAKKKTHTVRGVVTAVSGDSGKATITVKVKAGKKKASSSPTMEKTFSVSKDTKFQKVSGKKGQGETKAATLAEVQPKSRVSITASGSGPAKVVQIQAKGKKKVKT